MALQCSVADDATASFDARDFHHSGAGSSSGEGSPWAEQEVLAGSSAGRTSTITTRQKFLRADPGLEAVERGWNGLCPSERFQSHHGHETERRSLDGEPTDNKVKVPLDISRW